MVLTLIFFAIIFLFLFLKPKCCSFWNSFRNVHIYGDKIKEQLDYVPKDYDSEKTPIKRILIHTGLGSDWEKPKLDQGEFIGCPVSRCWLTVNRSLGPEVDAVIFRHEYSRPEFIRPSNQVTQSLEINYYCGGFTFILFKFELIFTEWHLLNSE